MGDCGEVVGVFFVFGLGFGVWSLPSLFSAVSAPALSPLSAALGLLWRSDGLGGWSVLGLSLWGVGKVGKRGKVGNWRNKGLVVAIYGSKSGLWCDILQSF